MNAYERVCSMSNVDLLKLPMTEAMALLMAAAECVTQGSKEQANAKEAETSS